MLHAKWQIIICYFSKSKKKKNYTIRIYLKLSQASESRDILDGEKIIKNYFLDENEKFGLAKN